VLYHNPDGSIVISSHGCWLPGTYADEKAAHYAHQFDDKALAALRDRVGRPITSDDLREERKGNPLWKLGSPATVGEENAMAAEEAPPAGHVDVQAAILSWAAQALQEQAPGEGLHYWVIMGYSGSYPHALLHVGHPGILGRITTVYSSGTLEWPVRQDQVNALVTDLLKAVLGDRLEKERQEPDGEACPAEPVRPVSPGAARDGGGPGEEDHGDDDEAAR
jgi:hypothetical protein